MHQLGTGNVESDRGLDPKTYTKRMQGRDERGVRSGVELVVEEFDILEEHLLALKGGNHLLVSVHLR